MKRLMLVLLVALGNAVWTPASAIAYSCIPNETGDGFDVVAKARRDVYRIGQTALVDIHVTDKITGEPQEDVDAGVFVEGKGDRVILDVSKTNENGHVLARLRLKQSNAEPGWARSWAGAWESINTPVYCTGRYGYREYPKLFRIS